mmetsp:Transcript_24428/g.58821  ORF Transcript_24428/g.58821 Transcript_24428/m.58821 type:complete len:99 (+) Transcript_24428:105-401(+)
MHKLVPIVLMLCAASAFQLPSLPQTVRSPPASGSEIGRSRAWMMSDEPNDSQVGRPKPTPNPNDSLYNTGADFELDAVTITALLGAAIAFQFFVIANM